MNHIYSYGYTRTRDFYKLDNNHDKEKMKKKFGKKYMEKKENERQIKTVHLQLKTAPLLTPGVISTSQLNLKLLLVLDILVNLGLVRPLSFLLTQKTPLLFLFLTAIGHAAAVLLGLLCLHDVLELFRVDFLGHSSPLLLVLPLPHLAAGATLAHLAWLL